MSSPDNSERLADAPISDYAPKWTGRSSRQVSPDIGDQPASVRDLGILRRPVDPEIVDFPQPVPRRLGWFAASGGFIIAGALGGIIGLLITGSLRNIGGNAPGSSTRTTELTSRFDSSKAPDQVSLPTLVLRSRRRPRSHHN
jgi:hypothetical protein